MDDRDDMRRLAVLMAATSLLMLISIHTAVATSSSLVWWEYTEWHYRAPVEINVTDVNITDCPVEHWVNFTQLLIDLNISGTFDENSTRVIEHNATTGTIIKEVSSRFDKSAGYNATTNATGEVIWTIDGTTLINSTRLYYIYFDIVENGVKSPPDYPTIDYPLSFSDTFDNTSKIAASTNLNISGGNVKLLSQSSWTQTTQADFRAGTLNNISTTTGGDVNLSKDVLFDDDFNWDLSKWGDMSAGWSISNGELIHGDYDGYIFTGDGDSWSNYNTTITYVTADGFSYFGLYARVTDVDNLYRLGTGNGYGVQRYMWIYKVVTGTETELAEAYDADGIIKNDGDIIRFEANGTILTGYVSYDGGKTWRNVVSTSDSTFSSGKAGVYHNYHNNMYFDDFSVSSIGVVEPPYTSSGTLTSSVYDAVSAVWGNISWNSMEPTNTSITIETRASDDNVTWSAWEQQINGTAITSPNTRYIQYRATLNTTNTTLTPTLSDVTICYYPTGGILTSTATPMQVPIISVIPTWNATVPASTTLSINVSVDNGTTWHVASNGTRIDYAYDLANTKLLYMANFTTSDVNVTPELHDINLVYRTELHTITQKPAEAGEIVDIHTIGVDENGLWGTNVTVYRNGTTTIVAQGTTNSTGHLRIIVSCRPTTENETFDINVSKRWYVDNSTSGINPPANVTLTLDHHVGLKAFGYLDKHIYWFGRGNSSSFTPTWTDDNVNPDYVIWPMAAVDPTDPIALKVREFNTIRAFVTVLGEKGEPVPNLTVKMWVINDTGYCVNKTASDDGNGRYSAVWDGWKQPNTTAAGYKAVGADGEAMYGKFTSRKTYYVYVDVNGDDVADLELPFMAYCVMDTHWAITASFSQTPSHCEEETPYDASANDAHGWYKYRSYGTRYHYSATRFEGTYGGPYCIDCHGWGDGVIPSMENISYGMVHPSLGAPEFIACNDTRCHGDMADPQTVPGYPAGTYNITAPYFNDTSWCTNCHTYKDGVTPTVAGHDNSTECKYCHVDNFHAIPTKENTPGYSSTYYGTCYRICHQVQEKHNNTLDCDQCHQNMTTAPFHQSNLTAIRKCDSCHQNVSYVAPQIPSPLNHSTGQKWGNYWNDSIGACLYCHNESHHSLDALGPPSSFRGDNIVNASISTTSTWCASCHYQGYSSGAHAYDDMVRAFQATNLTVPPEVTGNATYAPTAVVGYLSHSPQTTDCFACHGGNLSIDAGMTTFVHNVSLSEIADCISCHDMGRPATLEVDVSTTIKSIHKDLNKYATSTVDSQNKMCWACHGNGTQPSGTRHPSNYKNPRNCEYCHIGYVRFNASKVSEHHVSGDNIKAYKPCWACHKIGYNIHLLEIRFNKSISASEIDEKVAHYGEPLSETCISCHQNTTAEDYGVTKLVYKHANNTCITCHASPRTSVTSLHDENLTIPLLTCKDCHTSEYRMFLYNGPRQIKSHYPGASSGRGNTLLDDYTCEYCHGLSTTQKLHSGNLTIPSWGCADCHLPNGTGPRARYVHPATAHKSSTADCITCHGDDVGVLHVDCEWCHDTFLHDIQIPASTDCTSCHPAHGPVERSTCLRCHQYHLHLHAIRARVFTPYGWFKSNDSAYASSDVLHPAHKGDNVWARFATCAPCHGVVECDKCHVAPEVMPTPIPTPTVMPTPTPTVTPTPTPTPWIPGFGAVFATIGLLVAACALLFGRRYK